MKYRFSYGQIIAIGYLVILTVGTLLLLLPAATASGTGTDVTTALFTATSASCVTGLVVVDTGTYWSLFGQIVILCLIQIGGLGFMTLVSLFFLAFRRRMGLRKKELMIESINSSTIGGIRQLTGKILIGTGLMEGLGTLVLTVRFARDFPLGRAFFFGLFHAVSAFCNAGFDLLGVIEPYGSFVPYAGDLTVNAVILLLITLGGIGFLVWDDVWRERFRLRRCSFHTKLVLTVSALLTFGSAFLFWLSERNHLMADFSVGKQILTSLFASVSPRTAGMNTVDVGRMTGSSRFLTVFLMLIGGSPGSTAGGIKTTTFAVLVLHALASVRGQTDASAFGRRIREDAVRKAATILTVNLTLLAVGTFCIGLWQSLPWEDVLFEVASAIGTVGMTTGITRSLVLPSRYLIILLMYLGRVGSTSFATALLKKNARPPLQHPAEDVTIG